MNKEILCNSELSFYLKDINQSTKNRNKSKFSETIAEHYENIANIYFGKVISLNVNSILIELIDNVIENTENINSLIYISIIFSESKIIINTSNKIGEREKNILKEYINNLKDEEWIDKHYSEILESNKEYGLGLIRIIKETNSIINYEEIGDGYIKIIAEMGIKK